MNAVNLSVETCMISGFHCEVGQNCPLLGYYSASSCNFLPTFRDNLTVKTSGARIQKFWDQEVAPKRQ